jgi:hypothetical protein
MASPTIPIFAPDGTLGDVPYERLHDALAAGAKLGVNIQAPDGSHGVIPSDKLSDAQKAGAKPISYDVQGPTQGRKGFGAAFDEDVIGMAKSIPSMIAPPIPHMPSYYGDILKQRDENAMARAREGRSLPYQMAATVGEPLGINARGMETAANAGDSGAVLGHATASAAAAVAPLVVEGAIKGGKAAIGATGDLANAAAGKYYQAKTSAVRATIPEAAKLPPQAVEGIEKVFRASAPVGSDPQFRSQLYASAGDLAEIGRRAEAKLASAEGGVVQPDMRPKATIEAIKDYQKEMYQNERAPQIARHDTNLVDTGLSTDAKSGLEYLANNAGESATRSLAQKALDVPDMTLAEADTLARTVNTELRKFESMNPADKSAAMQTNSKISGLKDLDRQLGQKINTELTRVGEEGLTQYERRYAALSKVRDQLQKRANAVELVQPGMIKAVVQPVARALTGGKSGIASASQAAVADVNIGRMLQKGLKQLAKTDLQPVRSAPRPPVKGLLNASPIELGSSVEPLSPPSRPQPAYTTSRAQRKGLLLPDKAGGRVPLGPSSIPESTSAPAINISNSTRAQRLGLLLPERSGAPYVTPYPGASEPHPLADYYKPQEITRVKKLKGKR